MRRWRFCTGWCARTAVGGGRAGGVAGCGASAPVVVVNRERAAEGGGEPVGGPDLAGRSGGVDVSGAGGCAQLVEVAGVRGAGAGAWLDPYDLAEQRAMLADWEYARLHEGRWAGANDRLVDVERLRACVTLDGPQDPVPSRTYVCGVDVGLKRDRTAMAVCHGETGEDGRRRVVLDRLLVFAGTRARPVQSPAFGRGGGAAGPILTSRRTAVSTTERAALGPRADADRASSCWMATTAPAHGAAGWRPRGPQCRAGRPRATRLTSLPRPGAQQRLRRLTAHASDRWGTSTRLPSALGGPGEGPAGSIEVGAGERAWRQFGASRPLEGGKECRPQVMGGRCRHR